MTSALPAAWALVSVTKRTATLATDEASNGDDNRLLKVSGAGQATSQEWRTTEGPKGLPCGTPEQAGGFEADLGEENGGRQWSRKARGKGEWKILGNSLNSVHDQVSTLTRSSSPC
ncbi:hypothetical protein ANN_03285 [Periplaneta americana]|uniref:Secreted protein n=1 Tax=Periplaneta americana TaxID=6978 RepID=A0ABQ8TYJ4_PERAM|nr:hypothetical protein ANN_03285 [Periplaneta americana]